MRLLCFQPYICLLILFSKQLEESLKGDEVPSKEIMAMSEAEIENEIKEVDRLFILKKVI